MNRNSFGGQKPYFADFEISDEISPDPFSEEPLPHSQPHSDRLCTRDRSRKVKKLKKTEIAKDIKSSFE